MEHIYVCNFGAGLKKWWCMCNRGNTQFGAIENNFYFFELEFDLTPSKGEVVETAHTHGMDYYCSSSAPIVERPPMPPSPKSPKSKSPLPASSSSKIVGSRKKANTTPHCRKVGRPFLLITLLLLLFEGLRPQRSFSKYESGPVFGPPPFLKGYYLFVGIGVTTRSITCFSNFL